MSSDLVELVIILLTAHLLYDFHWQGEFVGGHKKHSVAILFVHALTWALVLSVALIMYGVFTLFALSFLFMTHFLIDLFKAQFGKGRFLDSDSLFGVHWSVVVDQLAHMVSIAFVVWFVWP